MPAEESAAFQELLGLIKVLQVDIAWMRRQLVEQALLSKELDARVRSSENATPKKQVSWSAVLLAGASVVGILIIILDRFYVAR